MYKKCGFILEFSYIIRGRKYQDCLNGQLSYIIEDPVAFIFPISIVNKSIFTLGFVTFAHIMSLVPQTSCSYVNMSKYKKENISCARFLRSPSSLSVSSH